VFFSILFTEASVFTFTFNINFIIVFVILTRQIKAVDEDNFTIKNMFLLISGKSKKSLIFCSFFPETFFVFDLQKKYKHAKLSRFWN